MPELPEVETIRAYLADQVVGKPVLSVPHLDGRMIKLGECDVDGLTTNLVGRQLSAVDRRGKYLLFCWPPHGYLVVHLGMSGRLTVQPSSDEFLPHTHMVIRFNDLDLRLRDPRRFGRVGWLKERGWLDAHLGIEPLSREFTGQYLAHKLEGRSAPIKALLLNQAIVAGLGNIYVDEALYLSRIHPAQPAKHVDATRAAELARNIRRVLRQSLKNRGTSFSDYVDALGEPGRNQDYLKVYGRRGQSCLRCGNTIETMVIGGRTSHFCSRCQPLPA